MFTKQQIKALLIPLVAEQILTGLMGVADTLMVSAVGEAAISGVSLVDSINMLVVYFFSALAAGGTIVCAQYIGHSEPDKANRATRQVMLVSLALSLLFCVSLATLRRPILRLIFGTVEEDVMDAAVVYFLITALSYPFLALYTTSAALHRAEGDSKRPMLVAAIADVMNIVGNALLIFVIPLGAAGAALSTLASRIFSAGVMLYFQHKPGRAITFDRYLTLRLDWSMAKRILRIGLPTAVENGMFQLGKLVVQSTVSMLGTTALAAQAVIATLEVSASMPAMAIGTGLLTVAGQCIGQGKPDEARRYTLQFTKLSTMIVLGTDALLAVLVPFVTDLTALSADGALLTCRLTWFICVIKLFLWPSSFTLPNGMRAAGDVTYAMWVSTVSMWVFRVAMSWFLCRYTSVGLWGVWIGWCSDWFVRMVCFIPRFKSGRWLGKQVIE